MDFRAQASALAERTQSTIWVTGVHCAGRANPILVSSPRPRQKLDCLAKSTLLEVLASKVPPRAKTPTRRRYSIASASQARIHLRVAVRKAYFLVAQRSCERRTRNLNASE